jgi:hypothetical protein
VTVWKRLGSWLRAVVLRSRLEREMDTELRFHIDAFAEDLVQSGVPREEALQRARIEFSGVERTKEECRDARGVTLIDSLVQDLAHCREARSQARHHGGRSCAPGHGL